MKKFRLRDYLPVLIMVLCAAIFGVLLATGVMDLDTVPQLVADRPVLAVLVVLGLYVLKGFSGVVVYNALVVMVSMVLPLPVALAVNGVGTAVCLSISYAKGGSPRRRVWSRCWTGIPRSSAISAPRRNTALPCALPSICWG